MLRRCVARYQIHFKGKNMPVPIKLAGAITLALAFAPHSASAGQLDYTLYAGVEHSDNINMAGNNPTSQYALVPGVNFNFVQEGSTIQANVSGNLQYRDYMGSDFTSQTQTQLAGQANWTVLPERLDFTVQDYAGIQPVDYLASNAPSNQQQTNVISLGPTLHFRLGNTLRGQAELRYINSYAQTTQGFNSSRGVAALRLLKELSPTNQLSLNAETQRTNFVNVLGGPNYNRHEVFTRYVSKLARFDIDAALGWSQLEFDGSTRALSSPLARLAVAWRPSERSTLALASSRQYSDAAQGMMELSGQQIGGINGTNTGNAAVNSQIYLERRLELSYNFRGTRFQFSLAPFYNKLDYTNDQLFNQTGRGGRIGFDYQLSPTFTLSTFAQAQTLTYQTLDRRDKSYDYSVSLIRQWTPHWGARASFSHQQRNSSVPGQSFQENRIYFGVTFRR